MALARTISDGEYSTEIKISYLTRLMGHNDDIFLDRYIMNSLSRILDPEYEKYVYYNEIKNYTYKIQ